MTTMSLPAQARVHFGVFEVDLLTRELFRAGHKVALQEQPFQVLEILLERRGELVSRDELRQRLWADTEFGDFDIGLNKAVAKLREALRDDASSPRYIETLPKRGYRFIGEEPRRAGVPPAAVGRLARLRSVTLVTVLIAIVVGAFWYFSPGREVAAPSGRAVVAVLPFRNLSADRAQDYFSDGLTVELITTLSRVHPSQLGVIAPTSVMAYRDRTPPVSEIGKELGAGFIVEGSVRRDQDRVRVTARLTRVDDQTQVWADAFERVGNDAFGVQSDVAEAIARAVQIEILPRQRADLRALPTTNERAYDEYLKGDYLKRTKADWAGAIGHFERAVELDPKFARAWVGVSNAALFGKPRAMYMKRSEEAARRAVALDPNLAVAHAAVGSIELLWHWNWTAADNSFRRAMTLPADSQVLAQYAQYLAARGQLDDAIVAARRALELDPRSSLIRQQIGRLYYFNHQPANAIYEWNKSLEIDPDFYWSHLFLSFVYRDRGDYKAWFHHQKRAFEIAGVPRDLLKKFDEGAATVGFEKTEGKLLEIKEQSARQHPPESLALGIENAKRGNREKALYWIEAALPNRPNDAVYLNVEPAFDGLRDDPRFQKLIAPIGFPPRGSPATITRR